MAGYVTPTAPIIPDVLPRPKRRGTNLTPMFDIEFGFVTPNANVTVRRPKRPRRIATGSRIFGDLPLINDGLPMGEPCMIRPTILSPEGFCTF